MSSHSGSERVSIVTGASSGIGRAVARRLSSQGPVLLIGRNEERLEETAQAGSDMRPVVGDLTDERVIQRIAARAADAGGRVDALIHSAGMIAYGTMEETPVGRLDDHYATNVRAPYALTRSLLPALTAAEGQVVCINSSIVQSAKAEAGAYGASKHALRGMADSLRAEVNSKGVRVLSVFPGRTGTPMQRRLMKEEGRTYRPERLMQPDDVALMVENALAIPRSAEVTEIWMRPMEKT